MPSHQIGFISGLVWGLFYLVVYMRVSMKAMKSWPEDVQNKMIATFGTDDRTVEQVQCDIATELHTKGLVDDNYMYIGSSETGKSLGEVSEQKSKKTTKAKSTTETTTRKTKDKIRAGGKRKNGTDGRLATMIIEDDIEIITEDITFEELTNRIRAAMDDYNMQLGFDWEAWRTKGKPQQWRGICSAVGKIFKKNRGILKQQPKIQATGICTNNGAYDYNGRLSILFDFYRDLCRFVGLPCKYYDFGDFAGIDFQTLQNWKEATSAGFAFYKKAMTEEAESIAACAEGSRIAAVTASHRLNSQHGWAKTSEVIHNTGGAVTPTASLPHFDAPSIENKGN